MLQDRTDDDAVKLRRHEHAQPPPMDERRTPNTSFRSARNVSRLVAVTRSLGTISSSRCQITRACKRRVDATHCMREFFFADELAGVCRVTSEVWWSQTESNRRPPACKAGALPTELWPRTAAPAKREWWAWEDLNFRPHAYQARALTN